MTYEEKCCLLCFACSPGIGPVTARKLLIQSKQTDTPLNRIFAASPKEIERQYSLPPRASKRLAKIMDPIVAAERIEESLERQDINILFEDEESYPTGFHDSLGPQAPPVLFTAGNPNILKNKCLGIVGSREPTSPAETTGYNLAASQAQNGITIVSGGARGIDTAAHHGALSTGATAVIPPVGILNFRWRGTSEEMLSSGQWSAIGQFAPDQRWRDCNALIRNRSIVALSNAIVAVEPRDKGGTWHSCNTALEMKKPLFLISNQDTQQHKRAIQSLVRRGAERLDTRSMPETGEFWRKVDEKLAANTSPEEDLFTP